ncbi:MAG TPA: polyprenyl synthetase family protein [Thermomicrobiaceae bacterium]|nr:polyprenyl synthetase family protein [Thermomicrobiaceae bacterium]
MLDETVRSRIVGSIGRMVAQANLTDEFGELILIPLSRPHKPLGNDPEWPWSALVIASSRSAGGDEVAAATVASAVECALAAADVFDEIEDGDASDLVDRCGAAQALNVAGGLLSLAYLLLEHVDDTVRGHMLRSQLGQTMSRFMLAAADGQHRDLAGEGAGLGPDEALAIAQAKAGMLGAMATRLGALLGLQDEARLADYERVGRHLATAGQIANDLRDASDTMVKSDQGRHKPSLPLTVGPESAVSDTGSAISFDPVAALSWIVVEHELQLARRALDRLRGLGQSVGPLATLLEQPGVQPQRNDRHL